MAIHSSILLLSPTHIEEKIDLLFNLISLGQGDEVTFEDIFVALVSFEKGFILL